MFFLHPKEFRILETLNLGVGENMEAMVSRYKTAVEEDGDHHRLRLIPNDKEMSKYVRELTMWVRRKDRLVARFEFTDTAGDRTLVEFDLEKEKTGRGLTDREVKLGAPPGTKIVEPLKSDR